VGRSPAKKLRKIVKREAAGHRIQLAIGERAMVCERAVIEVRSIVGLAHDVPQNPFCLSRLFQAAIAAAKAIAWGVAVEEAAVG